MVEQSRTQNNQSVQRNQKQATGRQRTIEQTHPALVLQRAQVAPTTLTHADVMTLQRTIGNRATGQLLQAKLQLGPAGDRYEQEADQVAKMAAEMVNLQSESARLRKFVKALDCECDSYFSFTCERCVALKEKDDA